MAEEDKNVANPTSTGTPAPAEPEERTYTQAQLDAIVNRKVQKATQGLFTADDMAAKDETIKTLTTERDTSKSEYEKLQGKVTAMEQEKILAKYGITGEDAEYYAFKIGKLNAEENAKATKDSERKTFEQTAEKYFKDKPQNKVRVDLGGTLGGKPAKQQENTNDQMNALIRGARK